MLEILKPTKTTMLKLSLSHQEYRLQHLTSRPTSVEYQLPIQVWFNNVKK